MAYEPKKFEKKWQDFWDEQQTFRTEEQSKKPKYYILDMFPYPSSSGLHVGHPEGYTATDILSRYKRSCGFNVLHPMGWDAFGLPAEQYAIKTGVHPSITTQNAIVNFKRQLKALGFSYDWSREVSTCDPEYYKWTQYLFIQLYNRGLAYQKEVPVNWCPELKTVLANEEVIDGKSERGNHPVFRVPMKQWMLKITSYAERLLEGLEKLDWPESTKELQRNWIGKSEGIQMKFPFLSENSQHEGIEIFTTRVDTLFGVTYLVLAPEHSLVQKITSPDHLQQVKEYQKQASSKSEISRQDTAQEKTGVFTGAYVLNPVNQKKIPVWVADYVLMGYGTGAVMGVPAHDERDFEFAKKFKLPIQVVITPNEKESNSTSLNINQAYMGPGQMIDSGFVTGKSSVEALTLLMDWVEEKSLGKRTTQYKLRDWLFSRQRYWGEPIPVLHLEGGEKKTVPVDELPVVLPEVQSYTPTETGESPLSSIHEWLITQDSKTGAQVKRETDTMPGSAGSSWYFLRFCDPFNHQEPFSQDSQKYWMPVDFYLGGPEHAVGHLLYSRFWTKVLFDAGLVSVDEPFKKLIHQGMILGEDGEKMSKSRGNVINPDEVIDHYSADTLRLYEMFMGPLERDKPWSTSAIEGISRFLNRTWRVFVDDQNQSLVTNDNPSLDDLKMLHKTIQKVTEDIENLKFNTAISQMMIFINHMTHSTIKSRTCLRPFVQLLQPFAPHIAEEVWQIMGEKTSLSYEPWPIFNPEFVKNEKITLAIQVMGKTRGSVEVELGSSQLEIEKLAKEIPTVSNQLQDKKILKIIFVKDKILNFVVQ